MTMITASTALTIFIMNIHHCGPEARPVPKWAKKFILQYLARICFVYEVGENCMNPQPEKPDPPPQRQPQYMNGKAGNDNLVFKFDRGQDSVPSKIPEEKEDMSQIMSPTCSMGKNPTNHYSVWKNGVFLSLDGGDGTPTAGGGMKDSDKAEVGGLGNGSEGVIQQQHHFRNLEYIANCYRDQRATQKRTGEWKKVAKVLDRFFMWIFFIMVFFMSLLIMCKAI